MDNKTLNEIENKISVLTALEFRIQKLNDRLNDAEAEVKSLLHKYEAEALDVEQIQKESLSNTILKLIRKYEGKVEKENQEMLSAKLKYDEAIEKVNILKLDILSLGNNISEIKKQKQNYEDELKKREESIRSNTTTESYRIYIELKHEKELLTNQLYELEEAISAANRVTSTAYSALSQLESAESWATFDAWTRGGIISHIAKYDHIDNAQKDFNLLNSELKNFQKELLDINVDSTYDSIEIDSSTRAIDFWFDNIFTDLSVRDKIQENIGTLTQLNTNINKAVSKLEGNRSEIKKKLEDIESKKINLVKSIEEID